MNATAPQDPDTPDDPVVSGLLDDLMAGLGLEWWPDLASPYQALCILGLCLACAWVANLLVTLVLTAWARRTTNDLDDRIVALSHRPVVWSMILIGVVSAYGRLEWLASTAPLVTHLASTLALGVWVIFALRISSLLLESASENQKRFKALERRTFPLFDNLAKLGIIGVAFYLLLEAWEVEVTGWIASAGVVSVVIGMAAQDSLSNLFAGVFIIADAPYRVGDYIVLDGGERGRVVNIGLRSTRILTRDDVEVTVPNSLIGAGKITNETAGPSTKHRIRIRVGVAYGTQVEAVRTILLAAAEGQADVCDDPTPRTRFRGFGESSIDFDLLCWIPEPSIRGSVVDGLYTSTYDALNAAGIEIPFPKRDVYVRELPSVETGEQQT